MQVGDLVKPNLRYKQVRKLKDQIGIVTEVWVDDSEQFSSKYEPHCKVYFPKENRSTMVCNRFLHRIKNK